MQDSFCHFFQYTNKPIMQLGRVFSFLRSYKFRLSMIYFEQCPKEEGIEFKYTLYTTNGRFVRDYLIVHWQHCQFGDSQSFSDLIFQTFITLLLLVNLFQNLAILSLILFVHVKLSINNLACHTSVRPVMPTKRRV